MSGIVARAFERAVKLSGYEQIDLSRGEFGQLLSAEARVAWYFFNQGWKKRNQHGKLKAAAKQARSTPDPPADSPP